MSDISPTQRPDHDPYKGTKVEPIEEKKEKEEFDRKEGKKTENAFAAAVTESFKKFLRLIFGGEARRFKITPLTMMQYIEKILDSDSEWIPFPFMKMLHNLFEENQKNPKDSQLEKWTKQIKEIIRSLQSLEEH